MPKVKTYNAIAKVGLNQFGDNYQINEDIAEPDAIMLRSFNLHDEPLADSVVAIGRAGAGVNNIPIDKMSEKGIVVFNAPGANANAVKELVIASLLLAARNLPDAIEYTRNLSTNNMKEAVENGKKQYAGHEITGKTLGVIGLGAIGQKVAFAAIGLGMKVIGYDPVLSPEKAVELTQSGVQITSSLDDLAGSSEFITIHVPLLPSTKGVIGKDLIAKMEPSAILLNFSRDELVDEAAVIHALDDEKLAQYVTDFPNSTTHGHDKVIALPHLGASTEEAEDNCAIMVANQLKDFLENGNIVNSVNFPNVVLERKGHLRLTFAHKNEPGVVAQITNTLGEENINIAELHNDSRGDVAYTIVDVDVEKLPESIPEKLKSIPQVVKLRVLN